MRSSAIFCPVHFVEMYFVPLCVGLVCLWLEHFLPVADAFECWWVFLYNWQYTHVVCGGCYLHPDYEDNGALPKNCTPSTSQYKMTKTLQYVLHVTYRNSKRNSEMLQNDIPAEPVFSERPCSHPSSFPYFN